MDSYTDIETLPCPKCGKTGTVRVNTAKYNDWRTGRIRFIQDAFPFMPAGEREQLLTGYHPTCFDEDFADEDED